MIATNAFLLNGIFHFFYSIQISPFSNEIEWTKILYKRLYWTAKLTPYLDEVIEGDSINSGHRDVEPWNTEKVIAVIRMLNTSKA